MDKITQEEFDSTLELHNKWLKNSPGGKRADFSGRDLTGVNMVCANMEGVNMVCANMEGANMGGANMAGVNMAYTNMAGANMVCTNMEGVNMVCANMTDVNMVRANMAGANMAGVNMTRANMARTYMTRTNMTRTNMTDAYMEKEYGKLITERPILQMGGIGRDNASLTATFCEKAVVVRRGCFYGTLEKFEEEVKEVHGDSIHGKEYRAVIDLIRLHEKLWKDNQGSKE